MLTTEFRLMGTMAAGVDPALWLGLLRDTLQRDAVTARRAALLSLLWLEGYQTRESLIARVERRLGTGCFGRGSTLTFRRDMQVIKAVMAAQGYRLKFSRRAARPGYYIAGRPVLAPETIKAVQGAAREIDPRQLAVLSRLSPAGRARLALDLSDTALSIAIQGVLSERLDLDPWAARREVLHRYYQVGG
jgi:hypothetical protein